MKLLRSNGRWVCQCDFEAKHIPKGAGFRWDGTRKEWYTEATLTAHKLASLCEGRDKELLDSLMRKEHGQVAASKAISSELAIPSPPGCEYMPFQKAGIAYAKDRVATLIADEMGLGKSIQAAGLINILDIRKVLVVCPATLKLNWRNELNKWMVTPHSVGVQHADKPWQEADICIINYDILFRPCPDCRKKRKEWKGKEGIDQKAVAKAIREGCETCKGEGFVIIFPELFRKWDLVIADESSYIKNSRTHRAKVFKVIDGTRKLALNGTPIDSRVEELFTILHWLDPLEWDNWFRFATQYCGLKRTRFGLDAKGATNLGELQTRLRSWGMIRRLKSEVMPELPPKTRQIIELPAESAQEVVNEEWSVFRKHEAIILALRAAVSIATCSDTDGEYATAVRNLREGQVAAFREMALARVKVAQSKIPFILSHLDNVTQNIQKVVFFGWHQIVLDAVYNAFKEKAVLLVGSTPQEKRQAIVESFQRKDAGSPTLFAGNIRAAGVGITLTASSTVVFGELDWVPSRITQAEDRCHRIGQRDNVLVQHITLEGSLDAYMARTIIAKQAIIKEALDGEVVEEEQEIPVDTGHVPETRISRREVVACSDQITEEAVAAIHQAIREIASQCDHAHATDARGFNKLDAEIGHSFAKCSHLTKRQAYYAYRIAMKYRKQLSETTNKQLEVINHVVSTH